MAKLIRFEYQSMVCHGLMEGELVWRISGTFFDIWEKQDEPLSLSDVRLLPPCLPSKIVAVGLNYTDHAAELNMEIPKEPILFIKPGTTICGPEGYIKYPPFSEQLDFEAELGVVIQRRTKDVDPSEAPEYILGYTCINDVTARDLQKRDGQWTRAKSFDSFCPIGPCIETELNPSDCRVECFLNGKVRQSSSTSNQIFSPFFLVSFISRVMTLLPGDVIATGTPPGVGAMKIGDEVEVVVEGIGRLKNYVI